MNNKVKKENYKNIAFLLLKKIDYQIINSFCGYKVIK